MGNLVFSIFFLVLFTSCAKNHSVIESPGRLVGGEIKPNLDPIPSDKPGDKPEITPTYLAANFNLLNEDQFHLGKENDKPVVIIFSGTYCVSCHQETLNLSNYFKSKGGIPTNIQLITLLIDADDDEIPWFKSEFGVNWSIGTEENNNLFKQVCPGSKVPCVIAQTPLRGFVFQKTGELNVSEVESITGEWKY